MADVAELKIILQDDGGSGAGAATLARPEEAREAGEPTERRSRRVREKPYDPVADAMKKYEAEKPKEADTYGLKEEYGGKDDTYKLSQEKPPELDPLKKWSADNPGSVGKAPEKFTMAGEAGAGAEAGAALGPEGAAAGAAIGLFTAALSKGTADIGKTVSDAGEMAAGLAWGKGGFEKLADVTEGAMKSLDKIPVVGRNIIGLGAAAATAAVAFSKTADAFVERGRELQKYSADIASARAAASVRELRSDIREAQTLGPGIASTTDASSRITADLREILLPFKEILVNLTAGVTELFAAGLDILKELAGFATDILRPFVTAFSAVLGFLKNALVSLMEGMAKLVAAIRPGKADDQITDVIKQLRQSNPRGREPKDRFAGFNKQQVGVPLFQGLGLVPNPG